MSRRVLALCGFLGIATLILSLGSLTVDDRSAMAAAEGSAEAGATDGPDLGLPAQELEPTVEVAKRDPITPVEAEEEDAQSVQLRRKVRQAIRMYEPRRLNTRDHSPWEIMHGFISFGVRAELERGGPGGPPVNAIGWLSWNGQGGGETLFTVQNGRPSGRLGPGLQGHPGQFMAMLAQSRVMPTYEMRINGKSFTVADLIEQEKLDCRAGTELTFKLIGLMHYLPSDTTWIGRDGKTWSFPKIVREEIAAPIRGAPCGGTHRLFAISYAYKTRIKRGEPVDGEYKRAQAYIADYQKHTFSTLQNPDGSFSTEWFNRPGNRPDLDRKIQTTGHISEWLVFSLNEPQLKEPRMVKAIEFLADSLIENPNRNWAVGPLGHALHALVMYDERRFRNSPKDSLPPLEGERRALVATLPREARREPAPEDAAEDNCNPYGETVPALRSDQLEGQTFRR